MFPKLTASVLFAVVILCLSVNDSVAKSFFENYTKKSLALNLDKSCPVTADLAKHNRDKANAVPQLDDVVFELRTDCNEDRFTMSEAGKLRPKEAFNVDWMTVVLIAPYIDYDIELQMAEAFTCRTGYNFLIVDTSKYLKGEEYVSEAINVDELGKHIAQGLQNTEIDSENIYLIGHGLGAHIAGSAGFHYATMEGEAIARITGLDPIRPCFKSGAIRKLQVDDATFVDVIHSNPGVLGLEEPMGNVDFYPGGMDVAKPGCDDHHLCSHNRAISYFIESVVPGQGDNFIATKCKNLGEVKANKCSGPAVVMGYHAEKGDDGIYALTVNPSAPYGNNDAGITNDCDICDME